MMRLERMMKRIFLTASAGLLMISILISCLNCNSNVDPQIVKVLKDNLKAIENEDLEAYMATLHPDAPGYWNTRESTIELFKYFDTDAKLERISLVEKSKNEAKIRVEQYSILKQGNESMKNRTTATHLLRKYNGKWHIYNSSIEKLENLN
jgi:ketosteroid isomerase-like protein